MRITEYRTKINQENALTELVKERSVNYCTDDRRLSTPDAIVKMMDEVYFLSERAEEYSFMIAFDTQNKPIGTFEISHGTVNATMMNSREIFLRAVLIGAVNIVLIHNHPSGVSAPSEQDISVTKKISDAGKLIGIRLMDHIIFGSANDYYSFKENDRF